MTFEKIIQELRETSSPRECLRYAYEILKAKYHWDRLKTYTRLPDLFENDPAALWNKSGFLHCTNLNILLKTLLIQSGHFSTEDIRFRWTQIWYISPHQYAQVRIDDVWIDVDVWAHRYGINFGDHAHGFH